MLFIKLTNIVNVMQNTCITLQFDYLSYIFVYIAVKIFYTMNMQLHVNECIITKCTQEIIVCHIRNWKIY